MQFLVFVQYSWVCTLFHFILNSSIYFPSRLPFPILSLLVPFLSLFNQSILFQCTTQNSPLPPKLRWKPLLSPLSQKFKPGKDLGFSALWRSVPWSSLVSSLWDYSPGVGSRWDPLAPCSLFKATTPCSFSRAN